MMNKVAEQFNKRLNPMELLEAFFLACIVNMNILRFAFSVYDTTFLLYGVYFLYVAVGVFNHKAICNIKYSLLSISVILLLFVAILTSFLVGDGALNSAVKFVVSVIIAYTAFAMSYKQIVQTIKFIVLFNLLYCIAILVSPENAFAYMNAGGAGTNYLTMTLTIGLLATISLSYFIYIIFTKIKLIKLIGALACCLIAFVTMLKFAARGSILLPILATIIIYILLAVKHRRKFLLTTIVLLIVAVIAFQIYINVADPYLIKRMLSLFGSMADEERLVVWTMYWDVIVEKTLFIFGGGTNSAVKFTEYYPHNIYLQLLGEFGIIGVFVAIVFTVKIVNNILKCNNMLSVQKEPYIKNGLYYLVLGAFLYYFLTFMKSFTLYDACPLFVFCAFLFRIEILINRHVKQGRKSHQYIQQKQRRVCING